MNTDDLDKLSKDIFSERQISYSIFCGNCGYNLRTLGYIGRCPECGNEYNARPAVRKGVYMPDDVQFPSLEMFAAMFFLGGGIMVFGSGFFPVTPWKLVMGFAAMVIGGISAVTFRRRFGTYLRFRAVARQVEYDDD